MKRMLRLIGWVLWYAFLYLAGLVFVVFLADGLYTDLNMPPELAEDCSDCFGWSEAEPWVYAAMLAYTAAWVAAALWRLARWRRRAGPTGGKAVAEDKGAEASQGSANRRLGQAR